MKDAPAAMRVVMVLTAIVVVLLLLSWAGMRFGSVVPAAEAAPRAAWVTHRWVAAPVDPDGLDALADRLRTAKLTDVYVHVGPLNGDGTLPLSRAPYAKEFAAALHERLAGLRVQAWLGQVEAGGGGPLDLGREGVRARVVASARRFMDLGYDGVHYDIEPIWTGDADFLSLLEATGRAAHADGKVLSVAAEELPLFPGADRVIGMLIPRYHPWTLGYHRRVAAHVDQLAVMTYDSAVPGAHLYQRFVARNTRLLAAALPEDVQLLIGVPSYADWNVGHWPAERPANALHGLRRGLARVPEGRRSRVGWALYAEWTTDADEWAEVSRADA